LRYLTNCSPLLRIQNLNLTS